MLRSERGIPLMLQESPHRPTLTAEDYQKWYSLYLVEPGGKSRPYLQSEDYDVVVDEFEGSAWGDHIVNPDFVRFLAKRKGLEIDSRSYEVIVGRWVMQYEERYER